MAYTKVSALTAKTTPAGTEELLINDGGVSKKITQTNLLSTALPLAGGTMTGTIAGFTSTGIDDNATSTAITIDASENVGIGTTSPSAALDIVSSGLSEQLRLSNTENDATTKYGAIVGSHYNNAEETITGMLMTSNSSTTGGSISIGGGMSAANAVNTVKFYTAANNTTLTGTERMRIDSDGLKFNGDTVAANALDDYQEGTWTPSVGGTATYTTQTGFYTKIGQMVTLQFEITINAIGTGDTVNISGVPFSGGSNLDSGCNIYYFSGLASNVVFVGSYLNSSVIALRSTAAAASSVNAASILGNGSRIGGTLTYKVI